MSAFREDLDRAADWVEAYLDGIGDRPVAASAEPGSVRARLPASPPEHGESFEAMLRDLDELIVPGLSQWNHPRFFAWFANTGSEPGILAELLIAALNVNAMTWESSPAATELEEVTLSWLAQLLGLPSGWHGHIEDTASTATVAALAAARTLRPEGSSTPPSRPTSASRRRLASWASSSAPSTSTTRSGCAPTSRSTTRRQSSRPSARPGRPRSTRFPSCSGAARRRASGCTSMRRTPARPPCAPSCAGASTAAKAPTRSSSIRTSGCSRRWTVPPCGRGGPRCFRATFGIVRDYLADTEDAVDLKDFGPALGRRFRALKLWFVLRWYGAEGLRALIREHVRLAQLFASWVEADPEWEVCAPHPFSAVCFRHRTADNDAIARDATATGKLFVAPARLRGASIIRLAIGNARTTEADVELAWEVLRECARAQ